MGNANALPEPDPAARLSFEPVHSSFKKVEAHEGAPPFDTRGVVLVSAIRSAKDEDDVDVTEAFQVKLDSESLSCGRHMVFHVLKGDKIGVKKLRKHTFTVTCLVDGQEQVRSFRGNESFRTRSLLFYGKKRMRALIEKTYFSEEELQLLYESFREAAWPRTVLSIDSFTRLFPVFNEQGDLLVSLFSSLDKDGNLDLDFEEYATAMSTMTRGNTKDKSIFAYNICDLDGDGQVSKEEVLKVSDHIQCVMEKLGFDDGSYGVATTSVDHMFLSTRARRDSISYTSSHHYSRQWIETEGKGGAAMAVEDQQVYEEEIKAYEVDSTDDDREDEYTFEDSLTKEKFLKRARIDSDLVECFGLFRFFYTVVVRPIEDILRHEGNMTYEGWITKEKGESVLMKTLSCLSGDRRWAVLRDGYLAWFKHPSDDLPGKVLDITDASVRVSASANWLFLRASSGFARYVWMDTREEVLRFTNVIHNNASRGYRFNSFAPVRPESHATWFINGESYFQRLTELIPRAQHSIFISDWYFACGLYLRRSQPLDKTYRLDNVLLERARAGIRVYIVIWNAPSLAFSLGCEYNEKYMNSLHENIFLLRHPQFTFPILWSHHQKFVVIDEEVAFVGGIDLCYQRYDDADYDIIDKNSLKFPVNGPPKEDVIDRSKVPRMPWYFTPRLHALHFPLFRLHVSSVKHDIHMMLDGLAARDVGLNFITRWNHALNTIPVGNWPKGVRYLLPRMSETAIDASFVSPVFEHEMDRGFPSCTLQVLRNMEAWSGGLKGVEKSIYKAYLDAIRKARHFIYIENQYFISSISRIHPKNRIVHALFQRICRAIRNKETFRAIVLVPVYPAGDLLSPTTRYIIKYVYKTISRQNCSLLQKLAHEFPGEDLTQYVTFHSLRRWGQFRLDDMPVTEQIYIHAKMLLVDDRIAIIGSANINDRSMLGSRDSETAVYLEQPAEALVPGVMAGSEFAVSPFVQSLRVQLWQDYLGLKEDERHLLRDPVCSEVYNDIWLRTSNVNSDAYKVVFPHAPERVRSLSHLKDALAWLTNMEAIEYGRDIKEKKASHEWNARMRGKLEDEVKGFLINFPMEFLEEEQMSPTLFTAEFYMPKATFL